MRPFRAFLLFAVLVGATFVTGCASQAIPGPGSSWAQATGQVQSKGGKVPVVGEIAIRYDNQNFLAEVTKGPSLPLVQIHAIGARPERVIVRGVLARGTWSGSPAKAPDALKAWVALPEAFHQAQARARGDNTGQISLADTKIDTSHAGGKITSIQIDRAGQRIICRLDR